MAYRILVATMLILSGCAGSIDTANKTTVDTVDKTISTEEVHRYEFSVRAASISPERARKIALRYMSLFHPVEFDGDVMQIDLCSTMQPIGECDYLIHHWGNGCGWSSKVEEHCVNGDCTYSLGEPFETKNSVCE